MTKNHTLIELTRAIDELNRHLTPLQNQLAANTQSHGKNTIAVEGITEGLKHLAKETGEWRNDDKQHHEEEGKLDKQKVKAMKKLITLFEGHPDLKIKRTN